MQDVNYLYRIYIYFPLFSQSNEHNSNGRMYIRIL